MLPLKTKKHPERKKKKKQSQKALSISSQEEKSAYLCYRHSIIKHPLHKDREWKRATGGQAKVLPDLMFSPSAEKKSVPWQRVQKKEWGKQIWNFL